MTLNYRSLVTITRTDLDDAVAAASEHIAPCGHNELENVYAAVEAAFRAVNLEIKVAPATGDDAPPLNGLTPDMVSVADFDGFSNAVLACFCQQWPGTNEARAARAALVQRKALAYAEMCRKPWECVGKGSCPCDPNCAD